MSFEKRLSSNNQPMLIDEMLSIFPTDNDEVFLVDLEYYSNVLFSCIKQHININDCVHSCVFNEEHNCVYQKLLFTDNVEFVFETNLDFLTFCQFVGLNLLPKSIEEA